MVEYTDQDVIVHSPYKIEAKNLLAARNILRVGPDDIQCINLQDVPIGASPILQIDRTIKCLKDISAYGGALMTASNPAVYYGTGGGCVQIGHGFQRSETWNPPADPPRINLTDDGFHTLYITAGSSLPPNTIDSILANMKLKDLTVNGHLDVGDSADGVSRYILIRGPNASGQTATLNFIDTYNYIKAAHGGNVSIGSYWGIDFFTNHNYSSSAMNLSTSGNLTLAGSLYLTGNTNGYLWNNGGYIRQSGGNGFIADGYLVVGTYATGGTGPALYCNAYHQICQGTSLRDYKTNIETLDDASWIYSLRPVTFDWKDDKAAQVFGRQVGLIAEEVQPYAPLLTFNDDKTGQLRGVMYEKLALPMLVELQKLRHEVDELKTKLAAS